MVTTPKRITSREQAIEILRGAGVIIDVKARTQTWLLGGTVSKKIVKAGAYLDSLVESELWKTDWVGSEEYSKIRDEKRKEKA